MPIFEKKTLIHAPAQEVFAWHERPGAFERLVPPWDRARVLEREGGIRDGARVILEIGRWPLRRLWEARHRGYVPGSEFQDDQIRGPFRKWSHLHRFLPAGEGTSTLEDRIDYEPPFGPLGRMAGPWIRRRIERTFAFRHGRIKSDLERLASHSGKPFLRVVMSGASGLIGGELAGFFRCAGHEVRILVRRHPRGDGEIFWDPYGRQLEPSSLEGVDAVIHLSGENIGAGRWTKARKEAIRESRVGTTRFLAEALAALQRPPRSFLVASAVGFYGNRGDEELNEGSPPGSGFLAENCAAWEAAAEPARQAGIRTLHVRTGVVVTLKGGAIPRMLPPFLAGAGGRIGDGRQWMSWIAMEDLVGLVHHLVSDESLSGPVNAVSPEPVTNREFTRVLGKVLRRPTLFPLPALAVQAVFGEMGEALLLEGQRVLPRKLEASGFRFLYAGLESALRWELGR